MSKAPNSKEYVALSITVNAIADIDEFLRAMSDIMEEVKKIGEKGTKINEMEIHPRRNQETMKKLDKLHEDVSLINCGIGGKLESISVLYGQIEAYGSGVAVKDSRGSDWMRKAIYSALLWLSCSLRISGALRYICLLELQRDASEYRKSKKEIVLSPQARAIMYNQLATVKAEYTKQIARYTDNRDTFVNKIKTQIRLQYVTVRRDLTEENLDYLVYSETTNIFLTDKIPEVYQKMLEDAKSCHAEAQKLRVELLKSIRDVQVHFLLVASLMLDKENRSLSELSTGAKFREKASSLSQLDAIVHTVNDNNTLRQAQRQADGDKAKATFKPRFQFWKGAAKKTLHSSADSRSLDEYVWVEDAISHRDEMPPQGMVVERIVGHAIGAQSDTAKTLAQLPKTTVIRGDGLHSLNNITERMRKTAEDTQRTLEKAGVLERPKKSRKMRICCVIVIILLIIIVALSITVYFLAIRKPQSPDRGHHSHHGHH